MPTRWFRNRNPSETPPGGPSRAPLRLHSKLPGYRASPLRSLPGIASELGLGSVWIKDESSRLGLPSFKVLGASWGVYRALESHLGAFAEWTSLEDLGAQLESHKPLTLVAATDGNHGRAVARMASLLSLDSLIFVPRGTASARIEAIRAEGARCEVVEGGYDDAVVRSAREASARCLVISDTSWPGYEDVPKLVIEGYSTIFWEVDDELERLGESGFDLVVVQMGVGALAAAAARHYRRAELRPRPSMLGVEPERAACVLASMEAGRVVTVPGPQDSIMAGLNCGTPSAIAWPLVSRSFDYCLAIHDERARVAMRMLADAGVTAGESGAAGLGGLLEALSVEELRTGLGLTASTRALIVVTEGATDPESYEQIVGRPPS